MVQCTVSSQRNQIQRLQWPPVSVPPIQSMQRRALCRKTSSEHCSAAEGASTETNGEASSQEDHQPQVHDRESPEDQERCAHSTQHSQSHSLHSPADAHGKCCSASDSSGTRQTSSLFSLPRGMQRNSPMRTCLRCTQTSRTRIRAHRLALLWGTLRTSLTRSPPTKPTCTTAKTTPIPNRGSSSHTSRSVDTALGTNASHFQLPHLLISLLWLAENDNQLMK